MMNKWLNKTVAILLVSIFIISVADALFDTYPVLLEISILLNKYSFGISTLYISFFELKNWDRLKSVPILTSSNQFLEFTPQPLTKNLFFLIILILVC